MIRPEACRGWLKTGPGLWGLEKYPVRERPRIGRYLPDAKLQHKIAGLRLTGWAENGPSIQGKARVPRSPLIHFFRGGNCAVSSFLWRQTRAQPIRAFSAKVR